MGRLDRKTGDLTARSIREVLNMNVDGVKYRKARSGFRGFGLRGFGCRVWG